MVTAKVMEELLKQYDEGEDITEQVIL